MKTFITAIIIIILMLLGFWYYMDKKCTELENANELAIKNAVDNAIDSFNRHKALNKPKKSYHDPGRRAIGQEYTVPGDLRMMQ